MGIPNADLLAFIVTRYTAKRLARGQSPKGFPPQASMTVANLMQFSDSYLLELQKAVGGWVH